MKILPKRYSSNRLEGFTIVELLIVIVIIGILAALVIVAYTGIQNRAKSTQYKTDAQAIVKKAEAVAADKDGKYPAQASDFTGVGSLSGSPLTVTTIASTATAPTTASAIATPRQYTVQVCTNNQGGLRVYYPDPATSTTAISSVDAGTYAANC